VKTAFADDDLRAHVWLTPANSLNVGRLMPQVFYYFTLLGMDAPVVSVPSGNFGNLTAGLIAKRAGLPIARFVAATNVNDVVPAYLESGLFEPRPSVQTLANAMDVGNPSNFERMRWLYHDDLAAMRRDVVGCRHTDHEVKTTIRRVYEERGYLLDPHSAIAYMGIRNYLDHEGRAGQGGRAGQAGRAGIFLATAHPAKFSEVVEPVLGRPIDVPPALAEVVSRPRHVLKISATFESVRRTLMV
jgi:threonine synthase